MQFAQWPIRRIDQNASVGAIERNTTQEGFTPDAACDHHVGDQDLSLAAPFT